MNTKEFSDEQKAALTDLLVLGMYQDRHVASAEDECIKILLSSFNLPSGYARQQFIDASFARVNQHPQTAESVRSAVFNSASRFKTEAHRRLALDTLAELLASDNSVTTEESTFLTVVKEALALNN